MIDTANTPHKVFPLGIRLDGDQLLLGIPEDAIATQEDIDAHVKKAQLWLKDLWEKANGFEERMKAIGVLMRPAQNGSAGNHQPSGSGGSQTDAAGIPAPPQPVSPDQSCPEESGPPEEDRRDGLVSPTPEPPASPETTS